MLKLTLCKSFGAMENNYLLATGVASAFPNTATVESDFSIIGWEKIDDQHDLTDFSL